MVGFGRRKRGKEGVVAQPMRLSGDISRSTSPEAEVWSQHTGREWSRGWET
jgi:hypothetical protein